MINMKEEKQRRGLCLIGSKKYVKTHNKNMKYDEKNKSSTYIIYNHGNNQNGCSMSEFLTHEKLQFESNIKLDVTLNAPDKNETGYIVEVDLQFPVQVHDKFKLFPPAPETVTPNID